MIKIITLHDICNPGSVFQAYALNKFVNDNGFESQIIDYVPIYSHIGKNKIKGVIRNILFGKNLRKIRKKYRQFINENIATTSKKYSSSKNLFKEKEGTELFIAGSDQLWNLDYDCGRDEAYYLSFAKNCKKISYATSLGKEKVDKQDLNFIADKIKDFSYLSVREKSSCAMLEPYVGKPIKWVCDPVFLLDKEDYVKDCKRLLDDKYLVVYLSAGTELLNSCLQKIKELTGYKVVLLGGNVTRFACDLHVKDMGPKEFISYIVNAELVISSSFHATAFSHIFHKKFGVILPEKNGERIKSLLALSNLENRIIESVNDVDEVLEEVDFNAVDGKINPFVKESKEYLLDAISSCVKD